MDRGFGHAGHPALSMSFQGAQGFCAWLAAHTHKKFRLPSEAEWELAARAGERSAWIGAARARWPSTPGPRARARTRRAPSRSKRANAYGLFDVIGNAGEWCAAPDGRGVMRGGTFLTPDAEARFDARRAGHAEWNRHDPQIPKSKWWLIDGGFVGLRVVCEDPPGGKR
jgi:formylglycine-generating enzyme required for sulfatase activity